MEMLCYLDLVVKVIQDHMMNLINLTKITLENGILFLLFLEL